MALLGSQIWTKPVYPNVLDDEFDSAILDPAWYCYDPYNTFSYGTIIDGVDAYDTSFTSGSVIRVEANPIHRRSWVFIQSPTDRGMIFGREITLPTNVLVLVRAKFSQYYSSHVSGDRTISLALTAVSGGEPDLNNRAGIYLNYPGAATVKGMYLVVDNGSIVGGINETTNVDSEGQAIEYMAIHKIGTTYHGWLGTASGNWIYMGSGVLPDTIAHLVFYVNNETTTYPGVGVFGVDFVRFYETENFLF